MPLSANNLFQKILKRPEFFALLAAILNGSIGLLTRYTFAGGLAHDELAFLKCFFAFIILFSYCVTRSTQRKKLLATLIQWKQYAVLAFLGIFCLYFFETWAFSEAKIALVSFLTYAASIVTIILAALFLREKITVFILFVFAIIISGVCLIFLFEGDIHGSALGIILALCGGLGYSLFIFFSKLFKTGSSITGLVLLFGFGSLYLFLPAYHAGFMLPSFQSASMIALLVLFPTIGGFYCTMRAISLGTASTVQIIETTDPLFSSSYALIFLGEFLNPAGTLGASLIFTGLILLVWHPQVTQTGKDSA